MVHIGPEYHHTQICVKLFCVVFVQTSGDTTQVTRIMLPRLSSKLADSLNRKNRKLLGHVLNLWISKLLSCVKVHSLLACKVSEHLIKYTSYTSPTPLHHLLNWEELCILVNTRFHDAATSTLQQMGCIVC